MKSDFSRFLHLTLSPSGLTRWSRWNKFATWFDLNTPIKSECNTMRTDAATCHGRSMVEMLGVLAIIGVLSIGAIAGYSKAMFKYKLNKQTTQIGYILDYIIANQDQLRQLPYYMKNTLNKLGVVPNEMVKDNTEYAYDVFNSRIKLENSSTADANYGFALGVEINSSSKASEICRNFLTMAKARADDVSYAYVQKKEADNSFNGSDAYYGNKVKHMSRYLRNMDMVTMDNTCKICADSDFCFVFILIGYKIN